MSLCLLRSFFLVHPQVEGTKKIKYIFIELSNIKRLSINILLHAEACSVFLFVT